MNFYIGMSIEGLNFNDYNVRIDEDIYEEYLYKEMFKFQKINEIDPYDNTVLLKDDILLIINDCNMVISSKVVDNNEFIEDIKELKILCEKALANNKNIICIGD